MRKHYLDNIRWVTVAIVVIYHVIYMYNAEGIAGVTGRITRMEVQYQDLFQYIVYPWIMPLLFIVSGISSRLYLDKHSHKEFIRSRTAKLLVPCTIGLVAFQFIQGYINASISGVTAQSGMPAVGIVIATILSGIGVLWYIQMLWLFSLALVLIRIVEKDRLWNLCKKTGITAILLFAPLVWGAGQILNTPIIVVYRFGLYFFVFLLGYFVFSHDEVIEVLKKWFMLFLVASVVLCVLFCWMFFGYNYADDPIYKAPHFLLYSYFASLAFLGGMAKYGDVSNGFTEWMTKRSFGLYVFHYLGISAFALYIAKPGLVPPAAGYILTAAAGFGGAYLLNAFISRIPFWRWAVLGISKKKEAENAKG